MVTLNWGRFSDNLNYENVVLFHWKPVSMVLLGKLKQLEAEGVSPDNIFLYGHSLGARMVIDAGISFGKGRISQIDGTKGFCASTTPFSQLFHPPKPVTVPDPTSC